MLEALAQGSRPRQLGHGREVLKLPGLGHLGLFGVSRAAAPGDIHHGCSDGSRLGLRRRLIKGRVVFQTETPFGICTIFRLVNHAHDYIPYVRAGA